LQEELEALEQLQNLDLSTLSIRTELKEIPENIEETQKNVAYVGDLLQKERSRLEESEKWCVDRERDISLQTDMLSKSKAKLQASRNEKESKAAQREIDTLRKTIQEREKEILDVMEAINQYRLRIEEHTKEFRELEETLSATEESGKVRMAEIESELNSTKARRAELAGRVPDKTLRLYERIYKRLGKALVEVVDGSCSGCNMGIQPQVYNEIQKGEKIFTCSFCHRILIYKPVENADTDE